MMLGQHTGPARIKPGQVSDFVWEKLELYNLESDRAEKENVAEKHPEVVQKFEEYLEAARAESPRWPMKKPEKEPDAKRAGKTEGAPTPPGR